jgi:hypothetical protein
VVELPGDVVDEDGPGVPAAVVVVAAGAAVVGGV